MYRQNNAHRCKSYSHQRVKQILLQDYHCILKPVGGYKANRKYGYVQKYNLINKDTGEVLAEWITINAIRIILTQEGYLLTEEHKPCKGAIEFLNYVENIKKN